MVRYVFSSTSHGHLLLCVQSNFPLSMITPPMVVPCPPMNFVAECNTISAPCSIGRTRYGVANVLSTISGIPCLCAIPAIFSISTTSEFGFPSVLYLNGFGVILNCRPTPLGIISPAAWMMRRVIWKWPNRTLGFSCSSAIHRYSSRSAAHRRPYNDDGCDRS